MEIDTELRDSTSDLLDLANSDIVIDRNDLFARPLDSDDRASIRRMTVMRIRVSSIGRVVASSLMEKTMELKAVIDGELASLRQ